MFTYLEEQVSKDRITEARALAAHLAMVQGLAPTRRRIRVVFGRALIRVGHWVAGRDQRRSHARRVTA